MSYWCNPLCVYKMFQISKNGGKIILAIGKELIAYFWWVCLVFLKKQNTTKLHIHSYFGVKIIFVISSSLNVYQPSLTSLPDISLPIEALILSLTSSTREGGEASESSWSVCMSAESPQRENEKTWGRKTCERKMFLNRGQRAGEVDKGGFWTRIPL